MISLSHCVVPISKLTVILSHIVIHLFFLKFDGSIVTLSSTNIASDFIFATVSDTLFFILKVDNSIITLSSINITSDRKSLDS